MATISQPSCSLIFSVYFADLRGVGMELAGGIGTDPAAGRNAQRIRYPLPRRDDRNVCLSAAARRGRQSEGSSPCDGLDSFRSSGAVISDSVSAARKYLALRRSRIRERMSPASKVTPNLWRAVSGSLWAGSRSFYLRDNVHCQVLNQRIQTKSKPNLKHF